MPSADNPFLDRIVERGRREPHRLFAEVWGGTRRLPLTWGDLLSRAGAFAAAYRRAGLGTGDIALIILRHGIDLYPAYLGVMLAGGIPSFLPFPNSKQDPDLYWSSHLAVFRRTGARLLVTYGELAEAVRDRAAGLVQVVDIDGLGDEAPDFAMAPRDETAVALLQHSSGTTGLKKGVALSYRAIRLQLEAYAQRLRLDAARSAIASWLPLYHDMGLVACFLLPAYVGVRLVSLDAFEWTMRPAMLLEAIEAARATHVWLPNFAFAHIARSTSRKRRYDLSSLEAAIGCSEPNKPDVFDAFAARFAAEGLRLASLQACYAMAETVFAVSQTEPAAPARRLWAEIHDDVVSMREGAGTQAYISNGRPLPGVEVRVLEDGRLANEGRAGEICVKAPFLFEGYFNDRDATGAAFFDGFFLTGDLGFVHRGEIYIFGRKKELIIVNGRNFFANDIEGVASGISGVRRGRCVAFGLYMPEFGAEQIVVVAERDGDMAVSAAAASITAALNAQFGTGPGDVRIVEPGWLIKTTSGKLSRAENIRKYVAAFQPNLELRSTPEAST